MSGPVWRLLKDDPATCTECGRKLETHRAVGKVVEGIFHATRRYCDDCYQALGQFLDEVA